MTTRLLVVIPTWNEAGNLEAVVTELRAVRPEAEVLVVDDGSTDGTAAVARRLRCDVLELPLHLGYGAAIQAGIKYGLRRAFPVVVTFDGDGQHDPRDIEPLAAAVLQGADVAVGSRSLATGAYHGSALRRLGRSLFAVLVRLVTRLELRDPTSGLKALGPKGQALFALARFPDRFPDADALVLASRSRLRVEERPACMRPSRNRHSMHDGRAVAYTFNMLFSLLAAAVGRPADLKR